MLLSRDKRSEHFTALTRRQTAGKHEMVRTNIFALLTNDLGMDAGLFHEEYRVVGGRADTLLGRTVFEYKSDLRTETDDVERKLPDYMQQAEDRYGGHFAGIATDGIRYRLYERQANDLVLLREFNATAPLEQGEDAGERLVSWLSAAVSPDAPLLPEPAIVRIELGRGSPAYARAEFRLRRLWEQLGSVSDVQLKRQLWAQQLERVYGSSVDSDTLFFQHTYLTVVAKTMATAVVGLTVSDPVDLLSGRAFTDADIHGAVESDFFDWVLEAPDGRRLVTELQHQVSRLKLQDVKSDVLKGLYESLIDPETRHELGEYYTPDWLAARVCERAIGDPLHQRVLDPACGSGTFLFQAILRLRAADEAEGGSPERRAELASTHVFGIDIHPVAVIVARVSYLLALGDLLKMRITALHIPVYLGDSLQWHSQRYVAEGEVMIEAADGTILHFPASVAAEPATFDRVVEAMVAQAEQGHPPSGFRTWAEREIGVTGGAADALQSTYAILKALCDDGRDHIWGYVARNLGRPVWLSSTGQRANVVVGNPPWLSYRYMSRDMQQRFRAECRERDIWEGGKVATHQDLSALFFVRSVELYLQTGGTIAFVMPYAAMNRKQFEGFRSGSWSGTGRRQRGHFAQARFVEAWTFDEHVQPLFPVPSCVLIAEFRPPRGLPARVRAFGGTLPRRDATIEEAASSLTEELRPWPAAPTMEGGSTYREAFRQGATVVPRMVWTVERVRAGALGGSATAPLVTSRRSSQEKEPWKSQPPLHGQVEVRFLCPLLLGESIGPFRVIEAVDCVIPWDSTKLLDASNASKEGWPHLAAWLADGERRWTLGSPSMSLLERIDFQRGLTVQFPTAPLRVVYAASGTLPAACVLRNADAVIEHKLYWAPVKTETEAHYLAAILSSETARARVEHMQSRGQWGARDFDKVMFELPIPKFDASVPVHVQLSEAGSHAEQVAAQVALPAKGGFKAIRGAIRKALKADGVAGEIDQLVAELLDAVSVA